MRQAKRLFRYGLLLWLAILQAPAIALPEIRVGVLKGGTVSWELAVIADHQLDQAAGISLKSVEFASPSAILIALQSGAVDAVVSDWLWVFDQRQLGRDYYYFPYSTAVGGMVLRADLSDSLCELKGRNIGIAGGPRDKNWAVIRYYCLATRHIDLAVENTLRFGAPPLLNALLARSQLDAVVNYWHFNARTTSMGHRILADTQSLLAELEVEAPVPVLGWVFSTEWADRNRELLDAFLGASFKAKSLLLESDKEWRSLRPLMKAGGEKSFIALRNAWRQGALLDSRGHKNSTILKTYQMLFSGTKTPCNNNISQCNSSQGNADDLATYSTLFWERN